MKTIDTEPVWVFLAHNDRSLPSDEKIRRFTAEYGSALGLKLPAILNVARPERNKPYFENAPFLHFSISHSNHLWVLALSVLPIGVDVQFHRTCDMEGIAKRFFHPGELLTLKNNGYDSFFSIWSAKESYVKYTGAGITDDYSNFSVTDQNGSISAAGNALFSFLPVEEGCTLCVCHESRGVIILKDTRSLG